MNCKYQGCRRKVASNGICEHHTFEENVVASQRASSLKQDMASTAQHLVDELKAGRSISQQDRRFLTSWLSAEKARAKWNAVV